MGILSSILGPGRAAHAGDLTDARYWSSSEYWPTSTSGVAVTPDGALMNPTVYACVHVIAEDLGTSADEPGTGIYEMLPTGGKRLAPNHPLDKVLTFRPNRYQTAVEWIEMMIGHACLRGNAYSEIVPGPRGPVDQLIPLSPDQVIVEVDNGDKRGWVPALTTSLGARGQVRYVVFQADGSRRNLADEQVFHLRGFSTGGVLGVSVIGMARNAVGLAMALERHGSRFFSNSARPGGVLKTKDKLAPDAIERMKQAWRDTHGGVDNSHKIAVLEQGLEWQQLGMTSEDAQFLQSRQFQVPEIARFFRMPLHKIQDLTRSTNNNIEHQGIEYVTDTIRPWAVRFQQAVRRDLIVAEDKYRFMFDLERLRQGDLKSQLDAYAVGRQWGFLSSNEIRTKMQMNPREDEGGDQFMVPLNMQVAGEPLPLDKRIEAVGQLVRAGYTPQDALRAVGMPQLGHLGFPPVTVQAEDNPAPKPPADNTDERPDEEESRRGAPRKRDRAAAIAQAAAAQLVHKEMLWVSTWAPRLARDASTWREKVSDFYGKHAALIVERLHVDEARAEAYCREHSSALIARGVAAAETWGTDGVAALVALTEEA